MSSKQHFKETEVDESIENEKELPILGKLPDTWRIVELGSVLNGSTRNGIYKSKVFHGKGAKIVNMGELFANPRLKNVAMYRVDLSKKELERFNIEIGDLLFARRSLTAEGAGKCSIVLEVNEPTTFESSIIRVRPNPKLTDSLFLYYLFGSRFGYYSMGSILRQVAVSGITGTDLVKIKIPLPPISEQHTIAVKLDALDSKIELNRIMNETLEKIGQAIFKHWFVDFEFPNEDSKPYRSSGGEMGDSELGEIPKRWYVEKLSNLLSSIESGRRPKGGIDSTLKEGVPSIGAENINGLGFYDYSSTKYISQKYFEQMKQGIVKDEDVLLYKDGASLGRKTMFGKGFPFTTCCVNEHVFILRANEKINQYFLYFWLNQNEITENIKNLNANSAQPGINKQSVGTLNILIPDKRILDMFEKAIKSVIETIFLNCLESRNLSQIRDFVLPKLISGEIRVNVPEKEEEAIA